MNTIYLIITIDTEEDNWGIAPIKDLKFKNITRIPKIQNLFDSYRFKPTYLCTMPVIENTYSNSILKEIFQDRKCDIGTHLHPWNTSPILEEISDYNSYIVNLPDDLLKRKISNLMNKSEEIFGSKPIIFRAGKWAIDERILNLIDQAGYRIDTSFTPYTKWYSEDRTPLDFQSYPYFPHYRNKKKGIGEKRSDNKNIFEIPLSIGFNKNPFSLMSRIYQGLGLNILKTTRIKGFLHYSRLLQKLRLSPEHNNSQEMLTLSKQFVDKGINLLNFSFHSSTLEPGATPFVKNEHDRVKFIRRIDDYFSKLSCFGNIVSVTSNDILKLLKDNRINLL